MDRSRDELEKVWWDGVRSSLLAGDWDDESCRRRCRSSEKVRSNCLEAYSGLWKIVSKLFFVKDIEKAGTDLVCIELYSNDVVLLVPRLD